jgi:predicted ester cyclase
MRKIGKIFKFLIPVIALVAFVVFMTGAGRRERVRAEYVAAGRAMEEAWNTGNVDALDEAFAPDYVTHYTAPNPDIEGREAYKKHIRDTLKDFRDVQLTIDEAIRDGNIGVSTFTWRGTHKGTGKQVTFTGCVVSHIGADGKIVEEWEWADWLGMLQQLGFKLVPPGE